MERKSGGPRIDWELELYPEPEKIITRKKHTGAFCDKEDPTSCLR